VADCASSLTPKASRIVCGGGRRRGACGEPVHAVRGHAARPPAVVRRAAGPVVGERLYEVFCEILASNGLLVSQGRFGAEMQVELVNDGPFTIWLDSDELGSRQAGLLNSLADGWET